MEGNPKLQAVSIPRLTKAPGLFTRSGLPGAPLRRLGQSLCKSSSPFTCMALQLLHFLLPLTNTKCIVIEKQTSQLETDIEHSYSGGSARDLFHHRTRSKFPQPARPAQPLQALGAGGMNHLPMVYATVLQMNSFHVSLRVQKRSVL